jgi:hypothetical protein
MRWNQLQNPFCGFVCAAPSFLEKRQMNALLIYPEFPDTYWSFKHALKFVGKRAAQPPLGLMTVACCGKTGQDCTVRLSKALRQSKMAAKAGNSERDRDSRIAAALPAAHA